jgi:hypothetical protein
VAHQPGDVLDRHVSVGKQRDGALRSLAVTQGHCKPALTWVRRGQQSRRDFGIAAVRGVQGSGGGTLPRFLLIASGWDITLHTAGRWMVNQISSALWGGREGKG